MPPVAYQQVRAGPCYTSAAIRRAKRIFTERGVKAGKPMPMDWPGLLPPGSWQPLDWTGRKHDSGKHTPGNATIYSCYCREDHYVFIPAEDLGGRWPCPCGGYALAEAARRFHANAAKLGVELLVRKYRGSQKGHSARCPEGHKFGLTPWDAYRALQPEAEDLGFTRSNICTFCARMTPPDVVYVVTGPAGLKFGITNGSGRGRLHDHYLNGYTEVVRLRKGLAPKVAQDLEDDLRVAMRRAHYVPLHGREYFEIAALPLVLDIVDSRLEAAAALCPPTVVSRSSRRGSRPRAAQC